MKIMFNGLDFQTKNMDTKYGRLCTSRNIIVSLLLLFIIIIVTII
jgi:hypothetical protein